MSLEEKPVACFDILPEECKVQIMQESDILTRLKLSQTSRTNYRIFKTNVFKAENLDVTVTRSLNRETANLRINDNELKYTISFITNGKKSADQKKGDVSITVVSRCKQRYRYGGYRTWKGAQNIWKKNVFSIMSGLRVENFRVKLEHKGFEIPRKLLRIEAKHITLETLTGSRSDYEPIFLRWLTQFVPNWQSLKMNFHGSMRGSFQYNVNSNANKTGFFENSPANLTDYLGDVPLEDTKPVKIEPEDCEKMDLDNLEKFFFYGHFTK